MELVRVRLVVTPTDLEGDMSKNRDCPIARSLKRRLSKSVTEWGIGPDYIRLGNYDPLENYHPFDYWKKIEQAQHKNPNKSIHFYVNLPKQFLN